MPTDVQIDSSPVVGGSPRPKRAVKEVQKLQKDQQHNVGTFTYKKEFSDSITKITNEGIRRIVNKAGGTSFNANFADEIRGCTMKFVSTIVRRAILVARSADRTTVKSGDVKYALDNVQLQLHGDVEDLKRCKVFTPKPRKKKRSRGQLAVERIRFYQNQKDCFLLEHTAIDSIVKEVSLEHAEGMRWSAAGIAVIQAAVEDYLHNVVEDCVLCMIHAKRKILDCKDYYLTMRVSGRHTMFD